jgi:hypothetical protein
MRLLGRKKYTTGHDIEMADDNNTIVKVSQNKHEGASKLV